MKYYTSGLVPRSKFEKEVHHGPRRLCQNDERRVIRPGNRDHLDRRVRVAPAMQTFDAYPVNDARPVNREHTDRRVVDEYPVYGARPVDRDHTDMRVAPFAQTIDAHPVHVTSMTQFRFAGPGPIIDAYPIDPMDEVSGCPENRGGSPELHLCCALALLYNTQELPNLQLLHEPGILAEAMRLHSHRWVL